MMHHYTAETCLHSRRHGITHYVSPRLWEECLALDLEWDGEYLVCEACMEFVPDIRLRISKFLLGVLCVTVMKPPLQEPRCVIPCVYNDWMTECYMFACSANSSLRACIVETLMRRLVPLDCRCTSARHIKLHTILATFWSLIKPLTLSSVSTAAVCFVLRRSVKFVMEATIAARAP